MHSRTTFSMRSAHFVIVPFALPHQRGVKALTRAGLLVLGGFCQTFWVPPAQAADRVALAYDAAAGCPLELQFQAAVESRGGHFTGPSTPSPATVRSLRVSIGRDAAGFRGTLQAMNEDATSAEREVRGATCQEVVDALAVVCATALSSPGEPALAASAPEPPLPTPKREPEPVTTTFSQGRVRATGALSNAQIQVEAGTLRFDHARALTLFAGAEFGLVPGTVIPRYDLSLSAAPLVTTPGGKSYLHGAIPQLRLSYLGRDSYETGETRSELEGLEFALGVCWSPIYDTRGLVALLCGEYGAGVMNIRTKDGQGKQIQNKNSALGIAGLGIESQYNLGSLLHVGLKLGAEFMVNSFSAEDTDGSRIFESSQVAGYGMLGFGVHF